jgi:anti-sigma factor RsiW
VRCREIDDRIEAWLDGELPAGEARRIAAHVEGCAACAAAADWARAVRDGLRELPALDAPPALLARVKAVAREGEARRGNRHRLAIGLTLLAATLAVALGLTWRLGPSGPAGQPADQTRIVEEARPAAPTEVERAEREVRVALALVGRYTRRAGADVQRELSGGPVAEATLRGLASALAPLARVDEGSGGGPPAA